MSNKILFALLSCAGVFAQQYPASRTANSPSPVFKGRVEVSLHSAGSYQLLDNLVHGSTLIFQCTVLATLPTIQNGSIPETVQTPVVVAVNHLLKGAIDGDQGEMTVFQTGGVFGDLEVVVPEAPLMKTGEQFLLFLRPEMRILQPGESPRYYVAGGGAGLVKIVDGRVRMSPQTMGMESRENDPQILKRFTKAYDNITLDEFLRLVEYQIHPNGR